MISIFDDEPSDFSRVLPIPATKIDVFPKRLHLGKTSVPLDNSHLAAQYIYKNIVHAMESDWYQSLNTRSLPQYQTTLQAFLPWLSRQKITSANKFSLLKNFEAYRVNDIKVKPQSTGLRVLLKIISQGLNCDTISQEHFDYIDLLLDSTVPSVPDERTPDTLTGFFTSIPWFRNVLGESDYLQLESPKRLMESFSIVVAATLLLIINEKQKVISQIGDVNSIGIEGLNKRKDKALAHWSRDLLFKFGQLTPKNKTANLATELMFLDSVKVKNQSALLSIWAQSIKEEKIWKTVYVEGRREIPFGAPCIFSPEWLFRPSPIEQFLFSLLCAWQTIQPSDVTKLKRNNIVISKNSAGHTASIQISYYKGRSGYEHETPLLDPNSIEGKALCAYLELLPTEDSNLFNIEAHRMIGLIFDFHPSITSLLARLWSSELISSYICTQLSIRGASDLFMRAYVALAKNGSEHFGAWKHQQEKLGRHHSLDIKTYRRSVPHPIPLKLFGLNFIKTSAVYARTDRYRDNDLVNQNSHTAMTEKISYLTDANKEWVNQNGRLTRLVLHDIESYVYHPNLDLSVQKTHDLLLHTRIVSGVGNGVDKPENIRINSLGRISNNPVQYHFDIKAHDILVLDSVETVVNMLHYISEAEGKYKLLINNALFYFEQTVLPTVEWMNYVLQQHLSPAVVRQGNQVYSEVHAILPSLFLSELNGGIS